MEFGLHESIHIYSGGLGILAGDHLKSASDLDVPLCGIGILYEEGYFEQHLDGTGYQQENYPKNDVYSLPIRHALDKNGNPVVLTVPLPEGPMHFTVWRLDVGRIPLFLLDTNLPENNPELRHVTEMCIRDSLYGIQLGLVNRLTSSEKWPYTPFVRVVF